MRRYVLTFLALAVYAMLGVLLGGSIDAADEVSGTIGKTERVVIVLLGLAGILWVFRRADAIFSIPLSAEARTCALFVVLPALWLDVRAEVPCLGIAALVGLSGAIYLSRLGGWASRVGGGIVLGASGLFAPHNVALSLWWAYRRRVSLVVATWLTFSVAAATLGLIATEGTCVVPPGWGESGTLALGDQSIWSPVAAAAGPESVTWVYVTASLIAAAGLAWLLAFCRRRALSRPPTLDPKEIAFANSAAVILAPVLPPSVFAIFLPAAMIALEAWARSCVKPLRVAGGICYALAGIVTWAGAILGELATSDEKLATYAGWPWFGSAALLIVWPLFHRRSHPENLGRAGAGTLSTGTSTRPS